MLPESVMFAEGRVSGHEECHEVNISNDGLYEGEENVTVVLSSEDATILSNLSLTIMDGNDLEGISQGCSSAIYF